MQDCYGMLPCHVYSLPCVLKYNVFQPFIASCSILGTNSGLESAAPNQAHHWLQQLHGLLSSCWRSRSEHLGITGCSPDDKGFFPRGSEL